jgi:hypothetical protein
LCLGFGIVFVFKRENGTAKFEHRITENDMLWKTSKGNFLLQWEIAPLPLIAGGLNHPVSEESFDKSSRSTASRKPSSSKIRPSFPPSIA